MRQPFVSSFFLFLRIIRMNDSKCCLIHRLNGIIDLKRIITNDLWCPTNKKKIDLSFRSSSIPIFFFSLAWSRFVNETAFFVGLQKFCRCMKKCVMESIWDGPLCLNETYGMESKQLSLNEDHKDIQRNEFVYRFLENYWYHCHPQMQLMLWVANNWTEKKQFRRRLKCMGVNRSIISRWFDIWRNLWYAILELN